MSLIATEQGAQIKGRLYPISWCYRRSAYLPRARYLNVHGMKKEKITFLHLRNVNVSQLKNSLQVTLLEKFAALFTQVLFHAWAGWAFSMWFGRFSFSISAQKFILPSPPSVLVMNECECHENFAQRISTWQNFKLSSTPSSSALVSAFRPVSLSIDQN